MIRNYFAAANAWIGAALLTFALVSCTPTGNEPTPSKAQLGERFTLGVGEVAEVINDGLRVRLDSVPEDSRCPKNAVCIWEGNARVRLTLTKSSLPQQQLELNTNTEPKIAPYQNYRVQLIEVSPYPIAGEQIQRASYKATIVISKQ